MPSAALMNMYTEASLEEAAVRFAASRGDEEAKERLREMSRDENSLLSSYEQQQQTNNNNNRQHNNKDKQRNNTKRQGQRPLSELSVDELWTRVDDELGCTLPIYEALIASLKKQEAKNEELKTVYGKLLSEFPMCYGYWIRLAKLHATWEERERVYRRGLSCAEVNPQLWKAFLVDAIDHHSKSNTHIIRSIMDRAIKHCGGHWLSWDLWRCCLEFEEAELRRVAEDITRPKDKLALEQTTIARLRLFYRAVLQTPHKHLADAWQKFQALLTTTQQNDKPIAATEDNNDENNNNNRSSMGASFGKQLQEVACGGVSLDVTDMLVEGEYEAFQTFVVDHYKIQGQGNSSWENGFLKIVKKSKKAKVSNSSSPASSSRANVCGGESTVRVRFPDHSESVVPLWMTTDDLRIACRQAGGGEEAVDLLVEGQIWNGSNNKEVVGDSGDVVVVSEAVPAHTTIVVFDGSTLSKALSLSSGKDVEKWFLSRRAEMVTQTSAKAIERELYEKKLSRTYYHPNPLTVSQLNAWRKYLDFMQAQGDSAAFDLALRRSLEVCCDYAEFWRKAMRFACKAAAGNPKSAVLAAGREVCGKATRLFGQRRPDLMFLYVDFLDKHGEGEEAKAITEELLSWNWPVLSDECYVRLLRAERVLKNYSKCEELLARARVSCNSRFFSNRMCIVSARYYLQVNKDKLAARKVLEEGWLLRPCMSILRQLIWVLQNSFAEDDNTKTILAMYSKALHDTKHFDVCDRWQLWKSLLFFADHNCTIQQIAQLQKRFADFRGDNLPFLSRKRPLLVEAPEASNEVKKTKHQEGAVSWCQQQSVA
eukprot:GHVS01098315.1.p1 GENE.GHVS01098315.1~~GHVS01098315.1.p1  ORF type:complete len:822 (-),score=173.14 GHVS01098315.1:303-2768(-)